MSHWQQLKIKRWACRFGKWTFLEDLDMPDQSLPHPSRIGCLSGETHHDEQRKTARQLALHRRARERITANRLPRDMPATVWAGAGSGERCSLCNKRIETHEVEFEYAQGNKGVRFHRLCHTIWQVECEQYKRPQEACSFLKERV